MVKKTEEFKGKTTNHIKIIKIHVMNGIELC